MKIEMNENEIEILPPPNWDSCHQFACSKWDPIGPRMEHYFGLLTHIKIMKGTIIGEMLLTSNF